MILITGGAGLLGLRLGRSLFESGAKVRLYDFRRPDEMTRDIEFLQGDIRNGAEFSRALEGVDTVFHLAALMHVGRRAPLVVRSVNVGGLKNLLQCAAGSTVKRIVFSSSIETYGIRPPCPCTEEAPPDPPPGYPRHKVIGEKLLKTFSGETGVEVVFPRMPMILGPGFYHFKTVLMFFEMIRRNLPVLIPGDGSKKGRMVAIDDAVLGLRLCADTPGINGEAFNICGADVFTHRELIEGVIEKTGSESRVVSVPGAIYKAAFDSLYPLGVIPVAREHFYFSLHDCDYSIEKARNVLGYTPKTTAIDAMVETYESYMDRGRKEFSKQLSNNLLHRK